LLLLAQGFSDYSYFEHILSSVIDKFSDMFEVKFVSCGASGADKFAEQFAINHGIPITVLPAK